MFFRSAWTLLISLIKLHYFSSNEFFSSILSGIGRKGDISLCKSEFYWKILLNFLLELLRYNSNRMWSLFKYANLTLMLLTSNMLTYHWSISSHRRFDPFFGMISVIVSGRRVRFVSRRWWCSCRTRWAGIRGGGHDDLIEIAIGRNDDLSYDNLNVLFVCSL